MISRPLIIAAAAITLSACSGVNDDAAPDDSPIAQATSTSNLFEIAQGDGDLTQLSQALVEAGLDEVLSGEGPFTILAPTDAAFAVLAEQSGGGASDNPNLRAMLEGHVIEGRLDYAELSTAIEGAGDDGHPIATIGGGTLSVTTQDGIIVITDGSGTSANISAVDVEATNGIIHVIDSVLAAQ